MQPVPTVPEPRRSPGSSRVFRAAWSRIACHEWCMSRERAARALLAVHARDHRPCGAVELVGGDDDGPEAGGEVLALGRPEADLHLRPLQVARRPVVHDGEAGDLPVGADRPPRPRARSRAPRSRPGRGSRRPGRRPRPGWRSRRPGSRTTPAARRARARRGPCARAARRRRSRGSTAGAGRAAAARRPRARNSSCSRASPPPVKNDCSVCAASWITRSPSIRPGQPRSRSRSFGLNMQSFTAARIGYSRLGVDVHVRDLGALAGGSAPRSRSPSRARPRARCAGRGRA